jgi:hypothetical protein
MTAEAGGEFWIGIVFLSRKSEVLHLSGDLLVARNDTSPGGPPWTDLIPEKWSTYNVGFLTSEPGPDLVPIFRMG